MSEDMVGISYKGETPPNLSIQLIELTNWEELYLFGPQSTIHFNPPRN